MDCLPRASLWTMPSPGSSPTAWQTRTAPLVVCTNLWPAFAFFDTSELPGGATVHQLA